MLQNKVIKYCKHDTTHKNSFFHSNDILYKQVLSSTVAKALVLKGGSRTTTTAHFVELMGTFFDCLNVGNYTDGMHHWKQFQHPYHSCNDSHFEV